MKKFDYKTVIITAPISFNVGKIAESFNEQIIANSENGWELVQIISSPNNLFFGVFKKEIN